MTTLKTTQEHNFNRALKLPYVGKVNVNEIGEIQVDTDKAQLVVDANVGFEYVDSLGPKASKSTPLDPPAAAEPISPSEEGSPLEEGTKEAASSEVATDANLFQDDLNALSVNDLKEIAKAKGFPGAEWRSLNKTALIEYLTNKAN